MAKRINQLTETSTIANDSVFAMDSATTAGKTNKVTFNNLLTNSKTATNFKTIMCAFTAKGSHNNHYSSQYWETKGKVDVSKYM